MSDEPLPLLTEAEFRREVHYRAFDRCQGAPLLPDIECWGIHEVHHLKRRPHCTDAEKVDPDNGRLLCTVHHNWVTEHPEKASLIGLHLWSYEEVPHDG